MTGFSEQNHNFDQGKRLASVYLSVCLSRVGFVFSLQATEQPPDGNKLQSMQALGRMGSGDFEVKGTISHPSIHLNQITASDLEVRSEEGRWIPCGWDPGSPLDNSGADTVAVWQKEEGLGGKTSERLCLSRYRGEMLGRLGFSAPEL